MEAPSPAPAPPAPAPALPTVHAEAVPSAFALHGGEHAVDVTLTPADGVALRATNRRSGDKFELVLDVDALPSLLPPGFPAAAGAPEGFYRFLLDAFAAEAGTMAADSGGATLRCVSREESATDEADADSTYSQFVVDIILTVNPGSWLAQALPVTLVLPLRAHGGGSSSGAAQQRELSVLRAELYQELEAQKSALQGQIRQQQQQLNLMKLQLNQRVFFGVNHSVHIGCTVLTMSTIRHPRLQTAGFAKVEVDTARTTPTFQHQWQSAPDIQSDRSLSTQQIKILRREKKEKERARRKAGQEPLSEPLSETTVVVDKRTVSIQMHGAAEFGVGNYPVAQVCEVPLHHLGVSLADVPSATCVDEVVDNLVAQLTKADTTWIMPLQSSELMPLQLCQNLESFTVSAECGHLITTLDFLENLPSLAQVTLHKVKVRDLNSLSTLPSLVRTNSTHC